MLLQVIPVLLISTPGSGGQCIEGRWHKKSPSPETDEFKTCHAFKNNSCCTAEFTVELMANETRNLYNHSWHRCGQLSQKCQQFWVTQECFYQCSPNITQYEDPIYAGALKGVPVCSEICDQWFDACKEDLICVENVLSDYNFTVHGENFCPANRTCITYQAMYRNGKNLCEKMWAGSYKYTVPNADYSNCLMMDGSSKPVKPTVESVGVVNTAYVALLQLLLFVVAFML